MANLFSSLVRVPMALTAGLLLGTLPLQAQLDPKLQAGKTDFMNLYQQATSMKAKPEIVSVFDYSGSMAALMYHPLFRNDDNADADDYRNMRFVLTPGTTGPSTPPNNRYRIRASDNTCTGAIADYIVTVNSTGAVGIANATSASCPPTTAVTYNTAPTYRIRVQADGNTAAYATITLTPNSTGSNPSYSITASYSAGLQTHATYGQFTVTMTPTSGSYANGTTVTLTSNLVHPPPPVTEPPTPNITSQSWSISTIANNPAMGGSNPNTYVTSLPADTETSLGSNQYRSVTTFTIPSWVTWTQPATAGNPTRLQPIKVESPGTPSAGPGPTGINQNFSSGATLTLNTWYYTKGSSDRINWTVTSLDNSNQSCVPIGSISPTYTTGNTTTEQHPGKSVTWTIPAYQDPATCTIPGTTTGTYVTITLEASQSGFNYSYAGITYVGTLTGNTKSTSTDRSNGGTNSMGWLIKPDGTAVTETDAANASTTSGLRGASQGSLDVRNWIRAASHVRFKYRVSSTPLVYRTIDIPIPWKVMNRDSSGNPLSSKTVLDKLVKTGVDVNGNPTSTTYGSSQQMELDLTYSIEAQARGVFASSGYSSSNPNPSAGALGTGAVTTAWLYSVVYKPSYISWLFTGKYQNTNASNPNYTTDSSLVGKYIVFDAASTTNVAGQTNVSWGQGFGPTGTWGNITVPRYNLDGTYRDTTSVEASKYGIPSVTRVQAVKSAAIQTWIAHQSDVFWAFRCLDPYSENGGGYGANINNDSTTTIDSDDATTTHVDGNDTGWKVLNNTAAQGITSTSGNSVTGMKRIASLFARGGTPLTYAMARSLAQYSDVNSVFNSVVGTDVSQCVNHYLLLFTDGVDNNGTGTNNGNSATPYLMGAGTVGDPYRLNALNGNQVILANKAEINRSGDYWNLFTFAGVAAHMADTSLGLTKDVDYMSASEPAALTGTPSQFLPFAIKKRNGIAYDKDHRITTMTLGVSLGGQYTDTSSPKRSLFLAAVVGDQSTKTGNLSSFRSFNGWEQPQGETIDPNNDWIPDPQDPTSYPKIGKRKDGAVFFFDATDPDKLSLSLDFAFRLAIGSAGNNATASPNLPFVGASLGKQVYIGNFQPPAVGGVIWPGDLFMYNTRESGSTIQIIDNKGDVVDVMDSSTAWWSASGAMAAKSWKSRALYTRLPSGTALVPFTDTGTGYTALKPYVATSKTATWSDSDYKEMLQNAAGGDILKAKDVDGRPVNNRTNIMGDIINSAPAALEYKFSDSTISTGIAAHGRLSAVADGERFRLILVGTNQGWIHAFGEVTKKSIITDSNGVEQEVVTGDVEELWAFMPTDFLKDLDYVYGKNVGSNPHRFMADGTPAIYHLDLPSPWGGGGDGVFNYNADVSKSERAIAVFGLRKGGRSYFALDIRDPFNPTLKWSLVPDESTSFDSTNRNLTSLADSGDDSIQTLIGAMGFSSSTPGFGRIAFTQSGSAKLRDAVFLGGGFSVPEVESNFKDADGNTILLGRSVMALDVYTGEVLAAADMSKSPYATTVKGNPSTSTVGPIATGLVPFEFFLNSGMAQRAYFTDYKGGLWSWGSKAVPESTDALYTTYKDYRIDSSDLAKWTVDGAVGSAAGIRKVYHDDSASRNWYYSTLPAPFRVGYFRGVGKGGTTPPAAVGVALVSGDRNNPLDFEYAAGEKPLQHRLTVVFDRQDSRAWGLDTESGPDDGIQDDQLLNATGFTVSTTPSAPCDDGVFKFITPSCKEFYLAPKNTDGTQDEANTKFGYYVNFTAAANTNFVSKGINSPIVVAGTLFYTYFEPTSADPCTGGTGKSHSMRITDVFSPIVKDSRTDIANPSGELLPTWTGVASDYIAFGTRGVIQGGTVPRANPVPGGIQTTIEMRTLSGQASQRFPKARVWRTVQ